MRLGDLTHGARFRIVRTGQTGINIGICGERSYRVVVLDENPRLTNFNYQLEVVRL